MMKKNKTNEGTGGYYDVPFDEPESGLKQMAKGALMGLGVVGAISWLEKHGDTLHDKRNKEELKKVKKSLKGYKFSKAQLDKKNKEGMRLKDVLSKLWMGN
tara:strand:+ start:1104 stop:1406 length:303 start_codon:yes stop_codon:yes gene_type:complete